MRFATRCFLWSFLPVAVLLAAVFWTVQHVAVSSVRDELQDSLRQTQLSVARMQSKSEIQNTRFLRIVGDNAPLKAGMQLMAAESNSAEARRTVEDQLREICQTLGFDFLVVSDSNNTPLTGIIRSGDRLVPMSVGHLQPPQKGFLTIDDQTYQITSVPVVQGDEDIGALSVGELFDLSELSTPAVLTRNKKVVRASVPVISTEELQAALAGCDDKTDCEVRLRGQSYLSLPVSGGSLGSGYVLRTLQNIDSASGPVQAMLKKVFAAAGIGALLAALALSVLSSRSIVRPLAEVVSRLRESARTGVLPEFASTTGEIQEIHDLTASFNHAAAVIHEAQNDLRKAYVEFVRSLASALDARDRYTAGHSRRVSEHASAIAETMNLPASQLEDIRVGALLHDIGKIGINDSVLQKTGKLTTEEFALIKQHPTIGRVILEGVHGFQPYLPVVELHHENWDGTGYPRGLAREEVPLAARIVHVVDAYDAMTSDRPYRRGMTSADALAILDRYAGSQFDPAVVEIFKRLMAERGPLAHESNETISLRELADAINMEMLPRREQETA